MFGLAYLVVLAVYLTAAVAVVRWAARHARRRGKSGIGWGIGAAAAMSVVLLGDWALTAATHAYRCANDSDFRIYKTFEEWNRENPGVLEALTDLNTAPEDTLPNWPLESRPDMRVAHINQRISIRYIDHFSSENEHELFFNVWRWKVQLADEATGQVLAETVDFSSGNGRIGGEPPLNFWIQSDHCPGHKRDAMKFSEFMKQFRGTRR